MKFGRLLFLGFVERDSSSRALWLCRCECGREKYYRADSLKSGKTKSCGCLQGRPVHGKRNTPAYRSWNHMVDRCTNEKNSQFKNYGGRGIAVCVRWRSFPNFLADMGERPPHLTLDRIDNDGNYEPANCRWATQRQQVLNQRFNRGRFVNTSGFRGVSFDKARNKWAAEIKDNDGARHRLGRFSTIEEAASAYQIASGRL